MSISFNEIGNDIRTPFAFVEFDPTRAQSGGSLMPYRILLVGQRLAAGSVPALSPVRVTSKEQAAGYFGAGSMLHRMFMAHFQNNSTTETIACALNDLEAGQAASGRLSVSGAAASGGTLVLYAGSARIRVGILPGMGGAEAAAAIAAAVNNSPLAPLRALIENPNPEDPAGAEIVFSARHKGEAGNDLFVRFGYHSGEGLPEGLRICGANGAPAVVSGSPTPCDEASAAVSAVAAYYGAIDPARPFQTLPLKGVMPPKEGPGLRLSGGSGNPNLDEVWAAVGDEHYQCIALPYTDASSLFNARDEMSRRFGPMHMLGGVIFSAVNGSLSAQGAAGDAHNSQHLCILGLGGPFERRERNLLLWDGISTFYTDADGQPRVERLITTYKTNPLGAEDRAYLDVETLLTLEYLRHDFRAYFTRRYPRHKLASDGARYGRGQAVITPKVAKAECIAWFGQMEEKGLVENLNEFKNELIVERNPDNECRLDVYLPPDLVNQLRVLAVQVGFRL